MERQHARKRLEISDNARMNRGEAAPRTPQSHKQVMTTSSLTRFAPQESYTQPGACGCLAAGRLIRLTCTFSYMLTLSSSSLYVHPVSDQRDSGNSSATPVQPVGTLSQIVATSPLHRCQRVGSALPTDSPDALTSDLRVPPIARLCHSRRDCGLFSTSPPAPCSFPISIFPF